MGGRFTAPKLSLPRSTRRSLEAAAAEVIEGVAARRAARLAAGQRAGRRRALPSEDPWPAEGVEVTPKGGPRGRRSASGGAEKFRHVEIRHGRIQLAGQIDIALSRLIVAVLHQRLQRVGRERRGIHGGECSAKIVEAIEWLWPLGADPRSHEERAAWKHCGGGQSAV